MRAVLFNQSKVRSLQTFKLQTENWKLETEVAGFAGISFKRTDGAKGAHRRLKFQVLTSKFRHGLDLYFSCN